LQILIICFSQSGNTQKIANCIQQGILEQTHDCRMCSLETASQENLSSYDLVGLGCPVFYYQEPLNVRQFITGLPMLHAKHWFLFCTHGSIIGNTFHSLKAQLIGKGVTVIGYHDTYADAWLPFYPHPTFTTGHPDEQDFIEARAFGKAIAMQSRDVHAGNPACQPEPIPGEWVQNAQRFTPEKMARMFPALRLDLEACTQCLACEQSCPVGGIDVRAETPRLQTPCIYCWRCVNICPEKAIQADWTQLVEMTPKLYARYRYWLNKAAETDRFRWLVDPEKVDFSNPYYLQEK